ncbi:hypothetical protein HNV28_30185 [Myxococcus xanthus]|uniref:TIGR02270 family protein n=1 Tax=Myxococcus xanthus TaxID=34 RepID=A0A7Y4MVC3_MYXXA|nr:HEAT repeat domain-containing protein [Myxococcus xanthus]NOJ82543.1 hypothetical protein [Myxococcus xanthus]
MSELAFLLTQRQRYLHDAEVEWPDVELLEVRIFRHVEAMRSGDDSAIACAREALASDASDELMAGIHARVQLGPDEQGIEEVLARLVDLDVALLPNCIQALMWVQHPKLLAHLTVLLNSRCKSLRAFAARVIGLRGDGGAEALLPLLDDAEQEVRAAAALAVSELGHRAALPVLERKLTQAPVEEMAEWALAALRLGSTRALHVCRQFCRARAPRGTRLPWLLGLGGEAQDFGLLMQLSDEAEYLMGSLEALGVLGVPAAAPLLLEHLGHERPAVKNVAAKALSLMSGAGLTETALVPDEEGDEGEAVAFRQVVQPSTAPAAWRAWWATHRARLEGASRLRLGQPFHLALCLEELAHPRTSFGDRTRAGLELVIRSGHHVGFQPDWLVRQQRRAIEQWRRFGAMHNWR